MSTPKINFFIFLYAGLNTGRKPPGTAELPGALRTIVRFVIPGADRARDSAGEQEEVRGRSGEQVMNYRGCPDPSAPIPNNCSRSPLGKVPIFKSRCFFAEFELHTQHPDGIITRTILRLNPDPDAGDDKARSRPPTHPEHFPLGDARPPPLGNPAIPLGSRYLLLLGFVRLLWDFLLV